MDIRVTLPGGKRATVAIGAHVLHTDQPRELGGEDTGPAPFDLFLASLAACAAFYVEAFCEARKISTNGVEVVQHSAIDEATHRLTRVDIEVRLPPTFPAKYRDAVVRAAQGCRVKKTLDAPPAIEVHSVIAETQVEPAA